MESTLREGGRDRTLRLIETMLWDGAACPRWTWHMARMAQGCAALGWQVREVAMPGLPTHPARVRLTLGLDGLAVEVAALPAQVDCWHVATSPVRLWSADPWLTVKSTRRAGYEAARAGMGPGLDEVILLNERGEVCDGSITTVFFDRGDGLRTPPLRCGVLPGVLRAQMGCAEEVLAGTDLGAVRLWLGNSMRGLKPARWVR